MAWEVVFAPEVEDWYLGLSEAEQIRVGAAIDYLAEHGPAAKRPMVGEVTGTAIRNLKELRPGNIRILFAFDPDQQAILLVAGDKSREGWTSWYRTAIPLAVERFERWLANPEAE